MRWIFVLASLAIALPSHGAVIVVETTADHITGPLCDIRDALAAADLDHPVGGCADGGDGDDIVDLSDLSGTIRLESDLPSISSNVTIQGASPSQLTLSGEGGFRIFRVIAGSVTLRRLTIANALATRGAALWVDPSTPATVRLEDSRISTNSAGTGSAVANDGGTVVIDRCLIDGNMATDVGGAAVVNTSGALSIENSTISGNTADGVSSLDAQSGPNTTTTINATTFYRNTNDGRHNLFSQAGATTQVAATVLSASGTTGANCTGAITSTGYNISDDATCSFANVGDMNGVAAGLAALAANGGFTATHALQPSSPALDGGVMAPCLGLDGQALEIDQRGLPRGADGNLDGSFRCDVGAFEAPGPVPEPSVGTLGTAALIALVARKRCKESKKKSRS